MRVGVTAHFQFSMFSGGGASSVISIAELLSVLGHSVTLINLNGTQEWWDDMPTMKQMYTKVNVGDIKEPFDIVFEVANTVKDKETRKRIAKQSIWVVRKPVLLNDIECSIFPVSVSKRDIEGLSEVWCLDHEVFDDELQYLETLTRVPVRKIPYVWSPSLIELYRKESSHPLWIQVAVTVTQQLQKVLPWSVHICETNNSASSSCTIPLVILREAKKQKEFNFQKYKLHNSQPLEHSEFFKQNVLQHCQIEDLSGELIGRQRVIDWALDPMSCILSHMRFRKIRAYMLEALWVGIPLVHNSPLLRSLGCGYENYYYEDNSISRGANALVQIQRDIANAKGMFQQSNHLAMQKIILESFSPLSSHIQNSWRQAINSLDIKTTIPTPVPTPVSLSVPVPPIKEEIPIPTLRVLFTDMWDGFNAEYNMFLLILQEGSKHLQPRPKIEGYSLQTLPTGTKPNLLLFGPFGNDWKVEEWKEVPKVHFTGENTPPIVDAKVCVRIP